ncbi:hypothetical protein N658DRAFT_490623, partial [Parathielavia hyrcaniae]
MERQQRKRLIQALKHERVINDALMQRLRVLTSALQSRQSNLNPADIAFQALMELASAKPEEDSPPPRPEGVFDADLPPLPTYSKMLVTVLDEVNNTLDERRTDKSHRYQAFAQELGVHVQKVQDLQAELVKELDTLEQQDSKKITSESYHAGFDSSYVNNTKPAETSKQETKIDVELLNPNHTLDETTLNAQTGKQTRTAADNSGVSEPTKIRASPAAMRFAEIPASDSRASRDHLSSHPKLLQQESETVGLLIEAYYALMLDQPDEKRARQYVHQALLLQYCRMLGRDGLQLVFKRITTPGHQARELFEKDVAERFQTIRSMAKRDSRETDEGVEQVQLYPAGENSSIRIQVPPVESEGEEARKAREIFEQFSPEMRAALERGLLEEVNNVS